MRATSLMYHDVISADDWDASGFPGSGAAPYKVTHELFQEHLSAIASGAGRIPTLASAETPNHGVPLHFTFDDGGVSFLHPIADDLEEQGWRGHFFITTDRIGTAGFMSKDEVKELADRGHSVGSHSCTHPTRMAACSPTQIQREWTDSVAVLSDLLGTAVTVASVPGGYYSKQVAQAANKAGITVLFNSEPTTRSYMVGKCRVLGRYTITRGTSSEVAMELAANKIQPRAKQTAIWKAKKVAKLAGPLYLYARQRMLSDRK